MKHLNRLDATILAWSAIFLLLGVFDIVFGLATRQYLFLLDGLILLVAGGLLGRFILRGLHPPLLRPLPPAFLPAFLGLMALRRPRSASGPPSQSS